MRKIDEIYTQYPFYGCRKITHLLGIDKDHVNRLMRQMGIEAIYPRPKTTRVNANDVRFPYLIRNVKIDHPDQVWSTDITYIPMAKGFVYLTSVIDWHSRYVLAWRLSNTLDTHFCIEALESGLSTGQQPEIFNTDQGCQFTSELFTRILQKRGIRISRDGRSHALDNIFVERFWRTLKYEEIYLHTYKNVYDLEACLTAYFDFYCWQRPHQALDYRTQAEIY